SASSAAHHRTRAGRWDGIGSTSPTRAGSSPTKLSSRKCCPHESRKSGISISIMFEDCKRPLANHRGRVLAPGLAGQDLLRPNTKSVTPLEDTRSVQDAGGRDVELRYFRDVDGREVDFVVVEGRQPAHFIDCKWADAPIDRGLRYLQLRFPAAEAWQLSA